MSLKLEVQFNAKTTLAQLKTVMTKLNRLPTEALNHFVSVTPIDKGNARRSTSLTGNKTIHANYAYAKPLDEGHSKQFGGKGMTKPTEKFIRDRVKQIEAGR